jgi:hypothetical protein
MSKLKQIFGKIDSILKAHNVSYDELIEEVKSRLKPTGKRLKPKIEKLKVEVEVIEGEKLIEETIKE